MIIFRKARTPAQTLNDLEAYISGLGDEPIEFLAREVRRWGEFSYSELEAAIEAGHLDELIAWRERYARVVNEVLAPMWASAFLFAAERASRGKTILSDSDPDVRNWLKNHGGELITRLSDESRRAIANVILHAQERLMNPKEIARQIRPLIGLNAQQAQANVNYRAKVYNRYLQGGSSVETATSRADKAALRYAGKQHRFRAETVTHTELAFAYNQGAHVGVQRAISRGLMSRCAMVWTTAGTNRVCPRCLPLKDKLVGYTDEAGVQIPPLHPRCRCAIDYREVGERLAGALKPESVEAEQHAFRYYGLVRSMKTDCRRIATNTGFRVQDIQRIKNHVFYKEHELYDGEVARFYPSYHMAQSWQRLIDGRNIQACDIVLLNHEFLESIIEEEVVTAQKAHTAAEAVYNYSELIK